MVWRKQVDREQETYIHRLTHAIHINFTFSSLATNQIYSLYKQTCTWAPLKAFFSVFFFNFTQFALQLLALTNSSSQYFSYYLLSSWLSLVLQLDVPWDILATHPRLLFSQKQHTNSGNLQSSGLVLYYVLVFLIVSCTLRIRIAHSPHHNEMIKKSIIIDNC